MSPPQPIRTSDPLCLLSYITGAKALHGEKALQYCVRTWVTALSSCEGWLGRSHHLSEHCAYPVSIMSDSDGRIRRSLCVSPSYDEWM